MPEIYKRILLADPKWTDLELAKAIIDANARQVFVPYSEPMEECVTFACRVEAQMAKIFSHSKWQPTVIGSIPEDNNEAREACFFEQIRTTSKSYRDYCDFITTEG